MEQPTEEADMVVNVAGKWCDVKLRFRGMLGEWERDVLRAVFQIEAKWGSLFPSLESPWDWGFASRAVIARQMGLDPEKQGLLLRISRTLSYLAGERGRDQKWCLLNRVAKDGNARGATRILILKRALKISAYVSAAAVALKKSMPKRIPYIYSGLSDVSGTEAKRDPRALKKLMQGIQYMRANGGRIPPWALPQKGGGQS